MKKRRRIRLNAPAVLGFTAVCLIAFVLSLITGGASDLALFSMYRSPLLSPMTWLRSVGHVFGHAGWDHLIGNLMYILILGPMLEEKYGSRRLLLIMLTAALVTGWLHWLLFPQLRLMGASGIVFALILLASVTGSESGDIPLTLILVAVLYLGQQIYEAVTVQAHISYMAHIAGGLVGGAAGLLLGPRAKPHRF